MTPEASLSHALSLVRSGRRDEALGVLLAHVERFPEHLDGLAGAAEALRTAGQYERSLGYYRRAIDLQPASGALWGCLGMALTSAGRPAEAVAAFERSMELDPHSVVSVSAYFRLLCTLGRYHDAAAVIEPLRAAGKLPLDAERQITQLKLYLDLPASEVHARHAEFARLVESQIRPPPVVFSNRRDPDRPLVVGYMSQDFRDRSVAHFIEPVLEHHDRTRVTPIVFSHRLVEDGMTHRLRSLAAGWVEIHQMHDAFAAAESRRLGVDVMVDLSGYTGGSRICVCLHGAAPVQLTYLGYPHATCLSSLHGRIVDSMTDLPGTEMPGSEPLIRLDRCFLAYAPAVQSPDVADPPCIGSAGVTFGSFNTHYKITPRTLDVWASVLRGVSGSAMTIKSDKLELEENQRRLAEEFSARGVDPSRVRITGEVPGKREHLEAYHAVDIALDTFPYNGTTTTMEALWMGVPVLTIPGDSHVSRVSASLLHHSGLSEFIAPDPDGLVSLARSFVDDRARLTEVRRTMRERLRAGSVLDAKGLARALEGVYRRMWRAWCAG